MSLTPDPILDEFREVISGPDEDIDLARAGLVIAKAEYPNLNIENVLEELNRLAGRARWRTPRDATPEVQIEALNNLFFAEIGLHGATEDYYDPRNSFLNEVLERRTGIPVSLSILYLAVGARAGVALGGTAVPMHFLVRVLGVKPTLFVDCYNLGKVMTEEQCREGIRRMTRGRVPFRPEMLNLVSNGQILTRLLTNLKMIYLNGMQYEKGLSILDRLVVLNPGEPGFLRERGIVRYRLGRGDLAREDLQAYLDSEIEPDDADAIRNLLRRIE